MIRIGCIVLLINRAPSLNSVNFQGAQSHWARFLLCGYALYLSCGMIVPNIGEAAAGGLLLLGFVGLGRIRRHFYPLEWGEVGVLASFAIFSVVSIISFFYWPGGRDARMHLEDYSTFMLLLPLYILLRQFYFNFSYLIVLFVLVSFLIGVNSTVQLLVYDIGRPSGGVNPMRYAAISLILALFPLNYLILFGFGRAWVGVVLVVAVTGGFAGSVMAMSRGTLIAVPILLVVYCMCLYRMGRLRFRLLVFVAFAFLLFVVGLSQSHRVQQTIKSIEGYCENGYSSTPLGARFDMFKAAGILISEKPVWGHGLNTYALKATVIRENTPNMSWEVGLWNNPHNEVLQVMVEKGFIGLFTLLLLFAVPGCLFLGALRSSDDSDSGREVKFYAISGIGLLIVYAVVGQSVALFEHAVFNHFFALVVLLFVSQIRVIGYIRGQGEG